MIAARMIRDEDGSQLVLIVLEPGNIEKLKAGQPIHKFLNEFIPELPMKVEFLFAYSPDVAWVAEQMKGVVDAEKMAKILEQSLSRPEVTVRDRTAEEMKRIF